MSTQEDDVESRLKELINDIGEAAKKLIESKDEKVTLIHHDDADGITACALLKIALHDKFTVQTVCLEKTYPQIIKRIQESGSEPLIYVDLGSPHLKVISSMNPSGRTIIIIDHHDMEKVKAENITVLNPEVYGVDGGIYACGASLAYVFAKAIKGEVSRHAHLAVIGSVEIPGDVKGINKLVLEDAVKANVATYDKRTGKRSVLWNGRFVSPESLSTKLTIMASVGYYDEGPQKAIEACIKSSWSGLESFLKMLEERRRRAYSNVIARLQYEGLNKVGRVQWFHVGDSFCDMGVKVIGTFCSYLLHQRIVDDDKVLIGFMNMKRTIPGLGELDAEYVKVSARAPKKVLTLMETGALEPLSKVVAEAAKRLGGFGDGHMAAASGIIPKGRERDFVRIVNELLSKAKEKRELKKGTLESFLFPEKVKK